MHLHLDVIRRVGQPLAALASFCGMGTMRDMSTLVFIVPQISLLKGVLTSCLELANVCPPSKLYPNPLLPIASQALPQWYVQPKSYQIHCFPLLFGVYAGIIYHRIQIL